MPVKETPFLVRAAPLPLPSSGGTAAASRGGPGGRAATLSARLEPLAPGSAAAGGARRVLITAGGDAGPGGTGRRGGARPDDDEARALRGLSSSSTLGNALVASSGVPGTDGTVVRVSVRAVRCRGPAVPCRDVLVDVSPVRDERADGSSVLGPPVAAGVSIAPGSGGSDFGGSTVNLRLVDCYGTVLSISLTSLLEPTEARGGSYLLPLTLGPGQRGLVPHPGSLLEGSGQVALAGDAVALALSPHLYLVDLSAGGAAGARTRVWTDLHRTTSDAVAESSGTARRSRRSLGTRLIGSLLGGSGEVDLEYNRDGTASSPDEGRVGSVPSVAAVTALRSFGDGAAGGEVDGATMRLATLHSDGSLRVWSSSPSARGVGYAIPSVQRVAVPSPSTPSTWGATYADPPLPDPASWDPSSPHPIAMRGRADLRDGQTEYEVALSVRCRGVRRGGGGGAVHVLGGVVLPADYASDDDIASLPCADVRHQELDPAAGGADVVDLGWSGGDLAVLVRGGEGEDGGDGGATAGRAGLHVHELKGGRYAVHPTTPPGLTPGGINSPSAYQLTVDEELGRFIHGGDDVASVDRAGMLALTQPFGRPRPSSLAVGRAMASLGIYAPATGDVITPTAVLGGVRGWSDRAAAAGRSPSSDLVEFAGGAGGSVYHAFASASRPRRRVSRDEDDGGEEEDPARAAVRARRSKWVRFLSAVRAQEGLLEEPVGLEPASSTETVLVRCGSSSLLSFGGAESSPSDEGGTASLDELSLSLLESVLSDAALRGDLVEVEASLYSAASRASCLVGGWGGGGASAPDFADGLQRLGVRGCGLLGPDYPSVLGRLAEMDPGSVKSWLRSPLSSSPEVNSKLSLSMSADDAPDGDCDPGDVGPDEDAVLATAAIIAAKAESARLLYLARSALLLAATSGTDGPDDAAGRQVARTLLFATSLCWSLQSPSRGRPGRTVAEAYASEARALFAPSLGLPSHLADAFVSSAYQFLCDDESDAGAGFGGLSYLMASPDHEPVVALRLLAPLVEYAPGESGASAERRRLAAECLIRQASELARRKGGGGGGGGETPRELWRIASGLLRGSPRRVAFLTNRLDAMESNADALSLCCGVVHDAVQEALSASDPDDGPSAPAAAGLWETALDVSLRGRMWDAALSAALAAPLKERRGECLARLVLAVVDSGSVGDLIGLGPGVADDVDLLSVASAVVEDAALGLTGDELLGRAHPNHWDFLYALRASRGEWREAARAMDLCGRALARAAAGRPSGGGGQNGAAKNRVMDDIALAAEACRHALGQVDDPDRRYLLHRGEVVLEGDAARRAFRAGVLRDYARDPHSPDSAGDMISSSTMDTIAALAGAGYVDAAVSLAVSESTRDGPRPGGTDELEDSLGYILCEHLVPLACPAREKEEGDGVAPSPLAGRSRIVQLKDALAAARAAEGRRGPWVVPCAPTEGGVQSAMAMDLLRSYVERHSGRCRGLAVAVAGKMLDSSEGTMALPPWLADLIAFGSRSPSPVAGARPGGLFASGAGDGTSSPPDPAGLVRLYMRHHRYGEACSVVTSVLSRKDAGPGLTSRLPEKGCVEVVPYGLIDMLWNVVDAVASGRYETDEERGQVSDLLRKREGMEQALSRHFESLRTSEDGIASARLLSS